MKLLGILVAFTLVFGAFALETDVSSNCLKCLCEGSTTNCDKTAGCDNQGFCGPFRISKHYWEEAGSFDNDFQKCAKDYNCAEKTVKSYMDKFGKDCDGDGQTDCKDFALIHHKGRHGCPYQDYQSDSLYKYVASCMEKYPKSQLGQDVKEGAQNVGDRIREQPQNIKDKAQQFGQDVKSGFQNIGENVKEKFHDTKDRLSGQAHDTKEQIKDGAEKLRERAHDSSAHNQDDIHQLEQHPERHQEEHQQLDQQQQHHHQEEKHDDDRHQESSAVPLPEMIRHRRFIRH